MKLGTLIGKGATAEVYDWGQQQVVKLYYEAYGVHLYDYESDIIRLITDAGAPAPAYVEKIEFQGRFGVVMEKVEGARMLDEVNKNLWRLKKYAFMLAKYHHSIHEISCDGLSSQENKLGHGVEKLRKLIGTAYDPTDFMQGKEVLCHGDLHLKNIILSKKGPLGIDWNGAYSGHPLGDVIRTWLILRSPNHMRKMAGLKAYLRQAFKVWFSNFYFKNYLAISGLDTTHLGSWIQLMAACRLAESFPGESRWLEKLIHHHHRQKSST